MTDSISAAPLSDYPPAAHAFYRFWYGHMQNDLMQPPLANIDHATARYIWDAAMAAASSGDTGQSDSVHSAATPAVESSQIAGRDGANAAPSDEGSAWIPVSERLPDLGEHVLTLRRREEFSKLPSVKEDWIEDDRDDGLFWSEDGDLAVGDGITHWMPLPTPPRQVAHSSQAQGELSVGPVVTNNDRMNEENQNG